MVGRVEPDLWPLLFYADEISSIKRGRSGVDMRATALFSAKESYFKLQYGMRRRWLEFHDIQVILEDNTFKVSDRTGDLAYPAFGAWGAHQNLMMTMITAPA